MQNIKYNITFCLVCFGLLPLNAQTLSLGEILQKIKSHNPQLKMYDAEIKSMDSLALGTKSWMSPQINSGFFMTPYNVRNWQADGMSNGIGQFMVGVSQMIPNPKRINAEYNYMKAVSSVEKESKNFTINQLNAVAKTNYYQWIILSKKISITEENLMLLSYMIKSMEIRYQYNMDKLPTYYKAQSQYSSLESMVVMLKHETEKKRIVLNTLMAQDKNIQFQIDTTYILKNFDTIITDSSALSINRSDLKALDKSIKLNDLKVQLEKTKFLPEFGVKYDHMFAFGQNPQLFTLMGMVNIPMNWSTKMNKANINSFKIKNEAIEWQKKMIVNETTGLISEMNVEFKILNHQYIISKTKIIPALKKQYETALLSWQNNTGNLFEVLEAWEALNMAQVDALDKIQKKLEVQVEIEKQLEVN